MCPRPPLPHAPFVEVRIGAAAACIVVRSSQTIEATGERGQDVEDAATDGGDGGGADDGEGDQGRVPVGDPLQAHPGRRRLQGGVAPKDCRLLCTKTIAMEFLFCSQSMQRGGIL